MNAKKAYTLFIVLTILSLLSILGAFYWGSARLSANSDSISALIAERDVSQQKIAKLAESKLSEEQLSEVNQLVEQQLPRKKEQDKLIADIIYTATAEAGIPFAQVSSFSFSGDASDPNELSGTQKSKDIPAVNEYPFNLQIDGITYETLLNLLVRIETNSRIVQVSNIQIIPDPENPDSLATTIAMKAYVQP
jgi:Tfp pilus assembly protein PilO